MNLRCHQVLYPCERLPVFKILRVCLIGVSLLLKGYAPIGILVNEQPDNPFCNIPDIEEQKPTKGPPSPSCKEVEAYTNWHSNSSHLQLLPSMDHLMPLILFVKGAVLPDKDEWPEAHGLVS